MKKEAAIVVLFLAICSISCKTTSHLCATKNHFLPALRRFGVEIFHNPDMADQHCKPEWSAHGTCCNSTTVADFLVKRSQSNSDLIGELLHQLASVGQNVKDYLEQRNLTQDLSNATSTDKAYLALSDILSSVSDKLHKDQMLCLKTMNDISQKSICDICSGRSQKYFQGGKYLIHEPVCRRVLNRCGNSWKALVRISQALRTFTNLVNDLSAASSVAQSLHGNITKYTNLIKLDALFKDCQDFRTCPFETVKPICEHFITVINPSYLERFTHRTYLRKFVNRLMRASKSLSSKILRLGLELKRLRGNNMVAQAVIRKKWEDFRKLKALALKVKTQFTARLAKLKKANLALKSLEESALNRRLQITVASRAGFLNSDIMVAPAQFPPNPNTLQTGFFGIGP